MFKRMARSIYVVHLRMLILTIAFSFAAGAVFLENEKMILRFNETHGQFIELIDKASAVNLIGDASGAVPVLSFTFVDLNGPLEVDTGDAQASVASKTADNILIVTWVDLDVKRNNDVIATITVSLTVELAEMSAVSEWGVSFSVTNSVHEIGLWEVSLSFPFDIASGEDGELFWPSAFGQIYSNPVATTNGAKACDYPSSSGSMQFMSLGSTSADSGAYIAALDGNSQSKQFQYSVRPIAAEAIDASSTTKVKQSPMTGTVQKEASDHNHHHGVNHGKAVPKALKWSTSPASATVVASVLTITMSPENAGEPLVAWKSTYKVAVGVVQNVNPAQGRPLWTQAAKLYRAWALSSAHWTADGPISSPRRNAKFPSWYLSNNVWLNTHWQCHDIFNATGGEPSFVLPYTVEVADRLQESALALHWYEWQQGPDPSPEGRYLFDTHYPDYFPARTDFETAVAELSKRGISTFPYINGRISDVNSVSYLSEDGLQYCTKEAPESLVDRASQDNLEAYVETYGSNASFCVTNPFTPYWQGKLADTVGQLVAECNVAGVYIDQIGSAGPKKCWDATHDHTLGGGDYWTTGYEKMMSTISERLDDARPMVTEDNAEPYMNMVQGYLTLNAYKGSLSQQTTATGVLSHTVHMVPAFPFIYGGYYVGFGAIWTRADFEDHDWWCSKLATMFTTGSQMGWFSLAGVNNDPNDGCGPMGVGDLFLSPTNDDLVMFLHTLSTARSAVLDYFVHGHLIQSPQLSPVPDVQVYTSSFTKDQSDYDTVLIQAWALDRAAEERTASILVVLVGATQGEYAGQVDAHIINWSQYFDNSWEEGGELNLDVFQSTVHNKDASSADSTGYTAPEGIAKEKILSAVKMNSFSSSSDTSGVVRTGLLSISVVVPARSVVFLEFKLHV